jgi:hypothetical protein
MIFVGARACAYKPTSSMNDSGCTSPSGDDKMSGGWFFAVVLFA